MRNIQTVAANTFREAVRDRVLSTWFSCAADEWARRSWWTNLIGIEEGCDCQPGAECDFRDWHFHREFLGVALVFPDEMDKRTLYALLAKTGEKGGIFAGKILRTGDDADRDTAAMLPVSTWPCDRQASAPEERCVHLPRSISSSETRADLALALLFFCFTTPSRHFVHRGIYVAGLFAADLRSFTEWVSILDLRLMRAISYLLPEFSEFQS